MARAQMAGQNPLFMGDAGLWNGILIVRMPKPIRFYAGDSLRWCASTTSETETATDLVPAAFGTSFAVDRALLLGGQALAEAWGKHPKSGMPFFLSEKELDHGDKLEILLGAINGRSKDRFLVDHGYEEQYTDHGVIAIDTARKRPSIGAARAVLARKTFIGDRNLELPERRPRLDDGQGDQACN